MTETNYYAICRIGYRDNDREVIDFLTRRDLKEFSDQARLAERLTASQAVAYIGNGLETAFVWSFDKQPAAYYLVPYGVTERIARYKKIEREIPRVISLIRNQYVCCDNPHEVLRFISSTSGEAGA